MTLDRGAVLQALRAALEPLDVVHAMWENGGAAFARIDEWSDVDLNLATAEGQQGEVFAAVEAALTALSPIELCYRVPQPVWPGIEQTFYRLEQASPFLMIDVAVMTPQTPRHYLQPEVHGQLIVHFDKTGFVSPPPLEREALLARLTERLRALRVAFPLFRVLVLKELNRGNTIEAVAFYHSQVLRPLVELLRIRHCPIHAEFYSRYVHYDLPPEVVRRLEPLYFVLSPEDLRAKQAQAEQWFDEVLKQIDQAGIALP